MIARALNRTLGRAGWGSEEHDGALEALLTDGGLVALRARKYRALAVLFRLDVASYGEAIDAILTPCVRDRECPLASASAVEAAAEASNWVVHVANLGSLQAEHVRLFGGSDRRRQMPSIADCGSMYADGGSTVALDDVTDFYARHEFAPRGDSVCPSHVAHELDFMAHLLERELAGEPDARDAAADFLVTHLFSWGVVFSAATYARSRHPVTRFAGLMLEHLLFCEAGHARTSRRALSSSGPGPV